MIPRDPLETPLDTHGFGPSTDGSLVSMDPTVTDTNSPTSRPLTSSSPTHNALPMHSVPEERGGNHSNNVQSNNQFSQDISDPIAGSTQEICASNEEPSDSSTITCAAMINSHDERTPLSNLEDQRSDFRTRKKRVLPWEVGTDAWSLMAPKSKSNKSCSKRLKVSGAEPEPTSSSKYKKKKQLSTAALQRQQKAIYERQAYQKALLKKQNIGGTSVSLVASANPGNLSRNSTTGVYSAVSNNHNRTKNDTNIDTNKSRNASHTHTIPHTNTIAVLTSHQSSLTGAAPIQHNTTSSKGLFESMFGEAFMRAAATASERNIVQSSSTEYGQVQFSSAVSSEASRSAGEESDEEPTDSCRTGYSSPQINQPWHNKPEYHKHSSPMKPTPIKSSPSLRERLQGSVAGNRQSTVSGSLLSNDRNRNTHRATMASDVTDCLHSDTSRTCLTFSSPLLSATCSKPSTSSTLRPENQTTTPSNVQLKPRGSLRDRFRKIMNK